MRTKLIEKYLAKAAHFRALANPETNHLQATALSTMLPTKALARAEYWEARAADVMAQDLAKRAARKAKKL